MSTRRLRAKPKSIEPNPPASAQNAATEEVLEAPKPQRCLRLVALPEGSQVYHRRFLEEGVTCTRLSVNYDSQIIKAEIPRGDGTAEIHIPLSSVAWIEYV